MKSYTDLLSRLRNDNAELAILKLLLHDKDLMAVVNGRLTYKDFYSTAHQLIYKAIEDMYFNNEHVDMVSLTAHLDKKGELDSVGGVLAITQLEQVFATKASLDKDIELVREMGDRRKLLRLGERLIESVGDMTTDVNDIQNGTVDVIRKMSERVSDNVVECKDSLTEVFDLITSDKEFGLSTGFFEIDNMIKGLGKCNLIILAGRPAMGKTALALNIISNVCQAGKSVLMLSLEMSRAELLKRCIYAISGISDDMVKWQNAQIKEAETSTVMTEEVKKFKRAEYQKFMNRLIAAHDVMAKWKLGTLELGNMSVNQLTVEAKIWQQKYGLDLLVIDYLQLMSVKGYRDNRVGEISYITRQLKLLAKSLDIPILLLSQLSRAVEGRADKRPLLSDLRESGSIEQDADKVMMLYRDSYYHEKADPWSELIVAKNRNGSTGTVKLDFKPQLTRFDNWDNNQIPGKEIKGGVF